MAAATPYGRWPFSLLSMLRITQHKILLGYWPFLELISTSYRMSQVLLWHQG